MSKDFRVLMLVAHGLIPPEKCDKKTLETANWKTEYDIAQTLKKLGHDFKIISVYDELSVIRKNIEAYQPHIIFNLLEEFSGICTYDYNIVGYLELLKVPHTGCNSRGLMLAKDKALSKKILSYHRLPTPKFFVCKKNHNPKKPKHINYPCIVKSLVEDASMGISQSSVVHNDEDLKTRVSFIHQKIETDAMIEEYIDGREFYVGVLGNQRLQVFPVWELKFDKVPDDFVRIATSRVKWNELYRAKHRIRSGRAVNLDDKVVKNLHSLSKRAFRRLDLNGYARFDYRVTQEGKIYLIEANPNPGIAYGEEFSDSAERHGISYENMVKKIISLGLSWHERRQ